jgi:ACS family hexuronate transporter-like MFS transporter
LSGALINRGWTVNRSRKTTMLVAALLIVPTTLAPYAGTLWIAVGIVSVAAAAHQWWSANLFTTVSDMFPRRAVASVIGIGGFGGAMTGMLFQRTTGVILEVTNSDYRPIFFILGGAYLAALGIIHLLVPRLEPATVRTGGA